MGEIMIISGGQTGADRPKVWNRLKRHGISKLNIAGNRESEDPGIYERTYQACRKFFCVTYRNDG